MTANPRAIPNTLDLAAIRADFPILSKPVKGHRLVYLDSGASAQKPIAVLDAMRDFQETHYANVHRGVHYLSQMATDAYEASRKTVAEFLGAGTDEIIFTGNATSALNLVAASYGQRLQPGDEIILTEMEHHANIVPWQLLRDRTGAAIKVIPVDDAGVLDLDAYRKLLNKRTKIVAFTHASNVLGTINPVAEIAALAHEAGAVAVVDGAQGIVHAAEDVKDLDVDFYAFTGHKLYGPTGIGVLYGKKALLDSMPPWQGGGEMIANVTFEKTTYREAPARFEAGTPAITESVGLAAAIDYVNGIGLDLIAAHEAIVLEYATEELLQLDGLRIYGRAENKCSIVSFLMASAHAHDIGTIVDGQGVAVRTGHHCAQPLMDRFGIVATARASFGIYSGKDDVDALIASLHRVKEVFSR